MGFRRRSAKRLGKSRTYQIVSNIVGVFLVSVGFSRGATTIGGLLLAFGLVIEIINIYAVSVVIEQARQEIAENRSEIEEMLSNMRELSSDMDRSKRDLNNLQSDIEQQQRKLTTTKEQAESASEEALTAKDEVRRMKRSIESSLGDRRY